MDRKLVPSGIAVGILVALLITVLLNGTTLFDGLRVPGTPADFPTVNNAVVDLPRGQTRTFYAVGRATVLNAQDYCLNIVPEERLDISWTKDVRFVYIQPKSGGPELVTVTSKPISECRSS